MPMIIRPRASPPPQLGGLLLPPVIGAELAECSAAGVTQFPLEGMTSGSCDPALGDVDGDGWDELIILWNRGEEDLVTCLRGDGQVVWETTSAAGYHAVYSDDPLYAGTRWHHRSRHRHLLTRLLDLDGDGELEVVVSLGPLHVLEAATGAVKSNIDPDGLAMARSPVRLDPGGRMGIIAGVNHHRQYGVVVAVDSSGELLWEERVPGCPSRIFCAALT